MLFWFIKGVEILIFCVLVIAIIIIVSEIIKLLNNPIPRTQNHDKRFSEIKNEYLHEMYDIKSR